MEKPMAQRRINRPDLKNESPTYWEEVLESHGLGARHLGLIETDGRVVSEGDLEFEEAVRLEQSGQ